MSVTLTPPNPERSRSFWQDARRRFFRNRLAVAGLVIVTVFLAAALFAPLLAPFGYAEAYFDRTRLFPFQNPLHPLGTDELGRDLLSRLIYGARTSLFVALLVQGVAFAIGVPLMTMATTSLDEQAGGSVQAVADIKLGGVLLGFSMMNFAYAPQDVAVEVLV